MIVEIMAAVCFAASGLLVVALLEARTRAEDEARHGRVSESIRADLVQLLERSRKQNVVYLAALREQKIRADKYRGIVRKLNREIRERNEASKPAEIFYGESLQGVTAGPADQTLQERFVARKAVKHLGHKIATKIGA